MGTRLADIIMDRHEDFLYEDSRAMKLTPYVMAERCLQAELTAIFLDGKEGDYSTLTYILEGGFKGFHNIAFLPILRRPPLLLVKHFICPITGLFHHLHQHSSRF